MEENLIQNAREKRLEYYRNWRANNKDKVREANRKYWEKKAQQVTNTQGADSVTPKRTFVTLSEENYAFVCELQSLKGFLSISETINSIVQSERMHLEDKMNEYHEQLEKMQQIINEF